MIRLLLVDDHLVVLAGLARIFDDAPDVRVVGEASSGLAALRLVAEVGADVVLMDLSMPGMDGVEATARILDGHPAVRVVVLTSTGDRQRVLDAVDAGAVGYLLKESAPSVIAEGVRSAARGEAPLHPRAARALLDARTRQEHAAGLTARELQVLRLVAAGLLNKQVARQLGIGEKTVKAHLSSVYQRLGVSNRGAAVQWAERHGLLGDKADWS